MIHVIPTTPFGDAVVLITMPDGEQLELTHGGIEDMNQLAAELCDWHEAWRDAPVETKQELVCGLCSGTGASPGSHQRSREFRCPRCGGSGVVMEGGQ